jgi:hypothetical protein
MIRIIIMFTLFMSVPVRSQTVLNIEGGAVDNSYNQVRIPGDLGTRFNLAPSSSGSSTYYRTSLKHKFNNKHGARLLYAPLEVDGHNTYTQSINFNNRIFLANNEIKSTYKFNSYRATYFYQFFDTGPLLLQLGATLKVRDARIRLKQDGQNTSRDDLGVVPLLYLWSRYQWENGFNLTLDFDGLVAPQGRAFDVALIGGYLLTERLSFNLGYRMLEGGADNDKVYNFSQFNFYFASLDVSF